jgi:hypothetical protein
MNSANRLMHTLRWVGVAGVILGGTSARGHQSEIANPAAREALVLCRAADGVPLSERAKILASGLERAEEAVQEAPQDAGAHFAVFCNLGKQMREAGTVRQSLAIGRLKRELDSALALDPDDPQLLVAKGAFLVELPPVFGGDAERGKALLRAALAKDPSNRDARRYLGSP